MSEIITNIRVITPDHWMKETDGKWYTHIPFECEENEDTLIEFIDSDELLEVTPTSLRIRKKILDPTLRKRASFKKK